MKTIPRNLLLAVAAICLIIRTSDADSLEQTFAHPPASARPWVYWFWNNGAVTKEGITADLEAMKRVGIGGVIIMDVVERFAPPAGTADFMGKEWQDDFQFALTEAARLGLEINMTNGPGWCGSSGPWITPELSMQHLVMAQTHVKGPSHFSGSIPHADVAPKNQDQFNSVVSTKGFYRDVAVLAFPETDNHIIDRKTIVNLTDKMDANGNLIWDIPPGKWIVQRFGHASTGSSTRPPVLGGNGLECDKLSAHAMDVHFAAMMGKLLQTAGPLAGKSFTATHIDSWEVGTQDWTPGFAEQFKTRWGYDLVPFLPELHVADSSPAAIASTAPANVNWEIDSHDMGDRFRWDFYQLISELLAKNYTGHFAELAHQHGLRFTLEGYNLPFADEELYTAAADEPMTEFWTPNPQASTEGLAKARQMASVAHIYGHAIVGAESFTSGDQEQWKLTPADIKALGDFEFSEGVNRFVIHRYAYQPWLNRAPGATMGPWGLHYERTNTWWEMSTAWHEYLSRCQWMLRQGHYVADLLYLRPQYPNQTYFTPVPAPPAGYRYDQISAEALIQRVSVKEGRLVLPDGMSYRMLVLPTQTRVITPELAKKLQELVQAGAVIYGQSPTHAPGLQAFPHCDDEVAHVAKTVWGDNQSAPAEHTFGQGKVFTGQPIDQLLTSLKIEPDFTSSTPINWIHRHLDDAEVYFIANPKNEPATVDCHFRDKTTVGELWDPQTGTRAALPADFHLQLQPSESDFVVFPKQSNPTPLAKRIEPDQLIADLSDHWQIAFPPNLGAPANANFDKLISWTDSPDQGIRHFSGTATYTRQFTLAQSTGHILLDLGDVKVMAHVKLNNKDLGILWKRPYRLDITDALEPGTNNLEIQVVNLWPNRMIGDAGLPENQRITWSTWQPFKTDTPLLPSGLIGLVKLWTGE